MSRVPVSKATIPDDVSTATAELYAKIAAFLDSREITLSESEAKRFFASDSRLEHPRQWGIVFYEGTEAAPFFSLDACAPGGGTAAAYEPWEAMNKHLGEFYAEQSWSKAVLYHENGDPRPTADLPTWRFVIVRDIDVWRLAPPACQEGARLSFAALNGHYVEAADYSDAVRAMRKRLVDGGYRDCVAVIDPRQCHPDGWTPFSDL